MGTEIRHFPPTSTKQKTKKKIHKKILEEDTAKPFTTAEMRQNSSKHKKKEEEDTENKRYSNDSGRKRNEIRRHFVYRWPFFLCVRNEKFELGVFSPGQISR